MEKKEHPFAARDLIMSQHLKDKKALFVLLLFISLLFSGLGNGSQNLQLMTNGYCALMMSGNHCKDSIEENCDHSMDRSPE
jgi:hypothetical protein